MSIDREIFENASEDELEGLSVPDRVFGFLAANEDRAFEAREIAAQVDLDVLGGDRRGKPDRQARRRR